MPIILDRRAFLRATAALLPTTFCARDQLHAAEDVATVELKALESAFGARLGVCALDTSSGREIRYRANERFPLCSTFKVILTAAILQRSVRDSDLLQRRIRYDKSNLVTYSPITQKHVGAGLSVADLCAAAVQYSDNTAGNLLMRLLGGPAVVTAFARSIGNREFRLDRWETRLNSALPGDLRDTATPAAMARSLRDLTVGTALPAPQRTQLNQWLLGNTTGDKRIRVAVPKSWRVGDKTGSGDYGTANDIAVLWPPQRPPLVLAIYSTHAQVSAKWNDALLAQVAEIVIKNLDSA